MAVTILERPYNMSWSKNDIRYVFQLDNLARINLRLQVRLLWSRPTPVLMTELYTFTLKPDAAGTIYFYFNDYLDSILQYQLPEMAAASIFTNADAQCCLFTITYRELSDGVDAPVYDTTEQLYTFNNYKTYCIKGGIEKNKHSRNNFFVFFNNHLRFLTWQPTDRMIDKTETAFLSILNPSYNEVDFSNNYIIRVDYTDINGLSFSKSYPFDELSILTHIRLKFIDMDTGTLAKSQLYKATVTLVDSVDGTTVLCFYNFYFEYRPIYNFYDLIYHNSLGGIDFVRVKGEVEESFERTTEENETGFDINDWNANYKAAESSYSSLSLQRKYKGDIGYLRVKDQQFAFLELLLSRSIYSRPDYRWIPVISLQKTQETGSARAYLNSFPIEWSLSESNQVYTPIDFYLPKGDLT